MRLLRQRNNKIFKTNRYLPIGPFLFLRALLTKSYKKSVNYYISQFFKRDFAMIAVQGGGTMGKSIAKFYLITILANVIFYFPIGMFLLWCVTETGEELVGWFAAIFAFVLLFCFTNVLLKRVLREKRGCITKAEIIQFLIPYFVCVGVLTLMGVGEFVLNWFYGFPLSIYAVSVTVKRILILVLPTLYSVGAVYSTSHLLNFYSLAILFSVLHMFSILFILIKIGRKKDKA